jgi:hypothetical protein
MTSILFTKESFIVKNDEEKILEPHNKKSMYFPFDLVFLSYKISLI